MTYERIYDLKFNKNLPTYVLERKFPREKRKISRLALFDVPPAELRQLVSHEELEKLENLKHWLSQRTAELGQEQHA